MNKRNSHLFPSIIIVRRTVELSRRSVASGFAFAAKGVTRVTVGFSDLLYLKIIS